MNIQDFVVYVLSEDDSIFDCCGEFSTMAEAREYIKHLEKEDAALLINDKYAIFIRIEIKLE